MAERDSARTQRPVTATMSAPDRRLRALVIQHEAATPGGLLLDWLAGLGAEITVVRFDAHDGADCRGHDDVGGYDLLVALGAEVAAYDDQVAWIPREARLLRQAHEAGIAVLGVCFGGQLLARALGARCYRAPEAEIGWLPVRSRRAGLVNDGPWFQWHFDTFDLPDGAELLADTDVGPQAYAIGRSMGVQFHPEVTPDIVADWVRASRDVLLARSVDPGRMLAETHQRKAESAANARRLFDAFLHRAVGQAAQPPGSAVRL